MITSKEGIDLMKSFESLHDGDLTLIGLQPKMCPAGYWTEGFGALVLDAAGNKIKGLANKAKAYEHSKIKTVAQAEAALKKDVRVRESMINSLRLSLNQGQFDALVSFAYNVGFENLRTSTLLKQIRSNASESSIRAQFGRWKYADGKIWKGLVLRRKAEADLFFS